jgi:hypothetical protein
LKDIVYGGNIPEAGPILVIQNGFIIYNERQEE